MRFTHLFFVLFAVTGSSASVVAQDFANVCRDWQEEIVSDLRAEYARGFAGAATTVGSVYKVSMRGSAEALTIARQIVGAHPVSAFFKGDLQCPMGPDGAKDVYCVFSHAYGSEEVALLSFTLAKQTGYFLSLDQSKMNGTWEGPEAWTLKKTFSMVPPHLIPKGYKPFRIYTNDKGIPCGGDPNHHACNEFESRGMQMRKNAVQPTVLIHMLAHDVDNLDDHVINGGGPEYEQTALVRRHQGIYISEYAAKNMLEDFAEHFTAYILNADALKKKTPETYEFLKRRYFDAPSGVQEFLAAKGWPAPAKEAFGWWEKLKDYTNPIAIRAHLPRCLRAMASVDPAAGEVNVGPEKYPVKVSPGHGNLYLDKIIDDGFADETRKTQFNAFRLNGTSVCMPEYADSVRFGLQYAAKAYLKKILELAAQDPYFEKGVKARDRLTACLQGTSASASCRPIQALFVPLDKAH